MRREHLEHIIGAAANITGEDEFVVIGSQAILGSHPDAALQAGLVELDELLARTKALPIDESRQTHIRAMLTSRSS